MESTKISESIKYIGANDEELKIFENQYDLPKGMAYNSYLIKDEKADGQKGTLLSGASSGTGFPFPTTIVRKIMALENIQKGGKQK